MQNFSEFRNSLSRLPTYSIYIFSILLFSSFIINCDKNDRSGKKEIYKIDNGKESFIKKPAGGDFRIISLNPNITEVLFFLEFDQQIIGITNWCRIPKDKKKGIIRVGSSIWPDFEKLISLNPEYIFVLKDHNLESMIHQLKSMNIAEIIVLKINSYSELLKEMKYLTSAFGLAGEIDEKIIRFSRKVNDLIKKNKNKFLKKKVYIDFTRLKPPLYSLGKGSMLHSILELLGAELPKSVRTFPIYNFDYILNFNPDVIIVPIASEHLFTSTEKQNSAEKQKLSEKQEIIEKHKSSEKPKWSKRNYPYKESVRKFWENYLGPREFLFVHADIINQSSPSVIETLRQIDQGLE
jgi:iron complex transport system substrate-binding protein